MQMQQTEKLTKEISKEIHMLFRKKLNDAKGGLKAKELAEECALICIKYLTKLQ